MRGILQSAQQWANKTRVGGNVIDVHLAYEATGIVGQRDDTHGPPEETLATIAGMWSAYLDQFIQPHEVAQMLLLLKIARGRYVYDRDHYLDAIGYTLIAESLARPWSASK
jgi:hypothetical protein